MSSIILFKFDGIITKKLPTVMDNLFQIVIKYVMLEDNVRATSRKILVVN